MPRTSFFQVLPKGSASNFSNFLNEDTAAYRLEIDANGFFYKKHDLEVFGPKGVGNGTKMRFLWCYQNSVYEVFLMFCMK